MVWNRDIPLVLAYYYIYFKGFLTNPNKNAETIDPMTTANKYNSQFPSTKGNTNIPPCGARSPMPNSIVNPPAMAEPTIRVGITRIGSAAAYGIAPSVIKDR